MAHFWLDLLWLRTLIEPKRTATVAPRIIPFDVGDEAITSGQPVAVQCAVSEGDLPIKFRWSFHGKELSSQMGISTMRINSRVSLLSIDSIAAGHAGDYTCTAQNSAGQANYTAALLVQGPQLPRPSFMFRILQLDTLNPQLEHPFLSGRSASSNVAISRWVS